jgi:hypothetical protein
MTTRAGRVFFAALGLPENGNVASLAHTEAVYLKRDGSISVVKKASAGNIFLTEH